MTPKQNAMLDRLAATSGGSMYVRAAEVNVARALERAGLAVVVDNGAMKDAWGRSDGERWSVELGPGGWARAKMSAARRAVIDAAERAGHRKIVPRSADATADELAHWCKTRHVAALVDHQPKLIEAIVVYAAELGVELPGAGR